MRRLLLTVLALLAFLPAASAARTGEPAAQVDSSALASLDGMVQRYADAISQESFDAKQTECDFLITSVTDTLLRTHIANRLFDIYRNSRVMGDEQVAIYLWDNWFKDHKLEMPSEDAWFDARLYADFNRNTLLGCPAPVLRLRKPCGGRLNTPQKGKASLMYFYETNCGKCKLESKVLPSVMKEVDRPVVFYAIYVGSDKKAWAEFRKNFKFSNPKVKVIHLWDPDDETDLLRLYGVLSTPKLYAIKSDGLVAGRRLELENILQILPYLD